MTATFIQGDNVSCSRVGGAMRRQSYRLRQNAQSLSEDLMELGDPEGLGAHIAAPAALLSALRAVADELDQAGAALQRYATDLSEAHELGRRAQLRVADAGLLLEGARVIEPWGPASAEESERRRALLPEVQARVDLASAKVGRARGRLKRELTLLATRFSEMAPTMGSNGCRPDAAASKSPPTKL